MTPPDDITTATALETLREMNAIKTAWQFVDSDELATALRLMPNRGRNQMLSKLRVPTAKVTSTTSRLVLTSLTRNPGDRLKAGKFITHQLAHQITEAIEEAISDGRDLAETMTAKAQELAPLTGSTIVVMAAVANAYTEPDYFIPFLVSCDTASLVPEGLRPLVEALRDSADVFTKRLESRHSSLIESRTLEAQAGLDPLNASWTRARAAAQQIQKTLRTGHPANEDDLDTIRAFSTQLHADAQRMGLSGEISVGLIQDSALLDNVVRRLTQLQGPDEMGEAIAEIRALCEVADEQTSRRLELFLELILNPSPLERITLANQLRLEPEPPSRSLLDAGIAGVLSIATPEVSELETPPSTLVTPTEAPAEAPAPDAASTVLVESTELTEPAPSLLETVTGFVVEEKAFASDSLTSVRVPDADEIATLITDRTPPVSPQPLREQTPSTSSSNLEILVQESTADEQEVDPEDVTAALCRLVIGMRFDMAYHLAVAAGYEYRAGVLAEAAFAHNVRVPNSPSAAEMVDRSAVPLVSDDQGSVLLRLASTLRVALVDPGSGAPAVLASLLLELDQFPALRELARTVSVPTSQMVSISAGGESLDAAAAIRAAADLATWANETIKQSPHHFQFHRATELWQKWYAPQGPIGKVLSLVASDDVNAVEKVGDLCRPFTTRDRIDNFIETEDRRLREGRTGRPQPLVGNVRRQLGRAFAEVIDQAQAWSAARGLVAGTDWSIEQRGQLAVEFNTLQPRVAAEFKLISGDAWFCAAAEATHQSIEATFALFEDVPLPGSEVDPESVLDRSLAMVPEIAIGESGSPLGQPTLGQILNAETCSPLDAFEARVAAEQFAAAEMVLDIADPLGEDSDFEEARVRLAAQERLTRDRSTGEYKALYSRFAGARARGRIDENTAIVLHSRLLGTNPNDPEAPVHRDLGALRAELAAIAESLEEAITGRREQVRADIESAIGDQAVSPEWSSRLRDLLGREELGAAEEYLYRAQAGEDPPDETLQDTDAVLIAQSLAYLEQSPLSQEVADAVRTGSSVGELDLSAVPDVARQEVASALAAWIDLRSPDQQSRWRTLLQPVLRLLGIVPTSVEQTPAMRSHGVPGKFLYLDVIGEHSGHAFVPSFGSRSRGLRRVMLAFQPMPAGQLWDTALLGTSSDQPVYVLYFDTLSAEGRVALAREARARETGQVMVIDDAVVLACAIAGRQAYDVTMRAALPYTAANPYNLDIPGEIPEEMFYGRRAERESIANLTGASFVSGGRRFGKTALLHSVRKRYALAQSNVLALFIMIQHVAATPQQSAVDLWPLLARRLTESKVLSPQVPATADGVIAGLRSWLNEDPTRHLLLLLDECDLFLRADSLEGFRNVAELRDLMIDFAGRFKVVFSGLQHVARYLKLPNQPLSQLPPPIVIGPLDPSAASDLVRRPLEALGFAPTPAQIDRIVTYCACNPSVIQLAGVQLVNLLRTQTVTAPAPWAISDDLLDRLLDSAELATGVRDRLFLTLNLDHRYKLLAYLVAFRALSDGLGTAVTPTELRSLAFEYWPDGFSSQRPDDVRALCDELVGLGIFAGEAGSGYRMLSPAAVRLFGTVDEVENELVSAFETYVADMTLGAAGSRPRIDDTTYSPLTASQLADVVGQGRTQIRVIIGSRALCSQDVQRAVKNTVDTLPNMTFTGVSSLKKWREMMTLPVSGHRVVIPTTDGFGLESFIESVVAAQNTQPSRSAHGTRSAVLVVGPQHREMLRRLVVPVGSPRPGDLADVSVSLGRVDLDSLRAWAKIEELDVVLPRQLDRLLQVTGGWPSLIEKLLLATRTKPFEDASQELAEQLATPEGIRELLADVGLDVDDPEQPADAGLVEVLKTLSANQLEGDPETLVEVLCSGELVKEKNPAEAISILQALGVLSEGERGELAVEPLIRQCLLRVSD